MPSQDLAAPLKQVWGYDQLRPLQEQAVRGALAGQDSLIVMPTGGGKSLCFQLPPLVDGGLTLVVSPLIALMKDQVDGLKLVGYPAEALHSNLGAAESQAIRQRLKEGELKLLYISPEGLFAGSMATLLQQANQGRGVARVAIDEAHCISQWGHDFRPEYGQLKRLRTLFPQASVQAFTATATPRVREDIVRQLALKDASVLVGTFDRPNLTYRVVPKVDPVKQSLEAIRRHPNDASIVYCLSRKDTEAMASRLKANGINASAYHAGLSADERREVSEAFAQERLNVVVATVAFGMGIDRSNVRVVIHETLPNSVEAYQQETGRAGRDGLPSECLTLYDAGDIVRRERLLRDSAPEMMGARIALLHEVRRFALSTQCRHAFLSDYFGQEYPSADGCDACDICLEGWKEVPESTKKAHQILAIMRALGRQHGDFGFGAGHVGAILAGSDLAAIRKYGHQDLRGYGAMDGTPASLISGWANQLADKGFLARTEGRFPALRLTEAGAEALQNRTEIPLRDLAAPVKGRRAKSGADHPAGFDEELFEALRGLRRDIAAERGVPAYVLFHDAVLIQMASARPTTPAGLARIPGIGDRKASDLGPRFLALIRSECEGRGLTTDVDVSAPPARTKKTAKTSLKRGTTLDMLSPGFEAREPMEVLLNRTTLSRNTVSNYLAEWIEGEDLPDLVPWVDPETYARVAEAISRVGTAYLRTISDALEGTVDYEVIRLVVAHRRSKLPDDEEG